MFRLVLFWRIKILRKLSFMLCCCMLIIFTGCSQSENKSDSKSIKIIATLFPQYDFAKNIAKDRAEVQLLLPPGTESHTYEPTPVDIISVSSADVFLYTGKFMEPWAEKIISSVDKVKVVDVSNGIELLETSHSHEEDHHHEHEEHSHEYDPHIWLDPKLACQMVDNIKVEISQVDPASKDFYNKNAEEYKERLLELDRKITDAVNLARRKTVVFAGRFAHAYFVKRYGLEYESAFSGCSSEMEPSVKKIAQLVDFINLNGIPCVYYEELSEPKVATSLADQTGVKTLKFSTAHNLSKEQIEKGTSYLDVMYENLENLKVGLN